MAHALVEAIADARDGREMSDRLFVRLQRAERNIAVALGNAPSLPAVMEALRERLAHPSELVREHVAWALEQYPCVARIRGSGNG